MNTAWLRENWALAGALAGVFPLVVVVLVHWLRSTARGQLSRAHKVLRQKRRALQKAAAAAAAAERRAARLQERADKAKPRRLEEAYGAVADTRALAKIARDQVLIAENHLRRIIVQEFPPARQARLRERYGIAETPDPKRFTF